jgi:hypothetical protein
MDLDEWAKSVVKQHDKNSNMMLEGDELRGLPGRTASADRDNDKVITVAELVASASDRGGTSRRENGRETERSSRSSSDEKSATSSAAAAALARVYAGSVAGTRKSDQKETDKRRTYRFTPPADRLPTGLPSWFKSRDRNNDGQVAMSEYSRSWSERTVNEFRRYDLNDDGVVTPKEAAK